MCMVEELAGVSYVRPCSLLDSAGKSLFEVSWFWSIFLGLLGVIDIASDEVIGEFEFGGK